MKQFLKLVFASMLGFFFAHTLMIVSVIFIFGAIAGSMTVSQLTKDLPGEDQAQILRLKLSGPIVERLRHRDLNFGEEVPFLGERVPLSLYQIQETLKEAAGDENIKGLYIDAGYVEAGMATLTTLRRSLLDFKKSEKFIYAYSDRYNEANYYISSVADVVFMYPQGDFELDGFSITPTFFKKGLEKLEIEPMVFRAGAYKSAVEPFIRNDLSREARQQLSELLSGVWKGFVKDVSSSRKVSQEELRQMAELKTVASAVSARSAGLVDELKFEDEVFDFLKGAAGVKEDEKVPFISVGMYQHRRDFSSPSKMMKQIKDEEMTEEEEESGPDKIAVIFAMGEIVHGKSSDGQMGAETIISALRKARKNESVKGIVLRINSPGGSALASDEIWREVYLANLKMPVIASMGDVAASGGYYIAAGAREIFAEANTITGSIGVFGLNMMMKNFFKNKLGVSFDRVVTHPFADMGSVSREMTPIEVEKVNQEIDRVYGRFLSVVEQGREISMDELLKVAEGRVWTGEEAKKRQLVDRLGGLSESIKRVAELANLEEGGYDLMVLPRAESPFKFVLNLLSSRAADVLGLSPNARLRELLQWRQSYEKEGVYTLLPYHLKIQ